MDYGGGEPVRNIETAEECAQICQDDPTCKIFEYSPGRKTCYQWEKCIRYVPYTDYFNTVCYEDAAEQGEHFLLSYLHS